MRTPGEPNCPGGYSKLEWNVTGPQGEIFGSDDERTLASARIVALKIGSIN